MTIGKKLYAGFGLILGILAVLFLVYSVAGYLEKSARDNASMAFDNKSTIESVRSQVMVNRLNMNNFLLSGDPRDEEKVNKGLTDIADLIKRGEAQANNDAVHTALIQVESTETSWADSFAKPLIAKRHQVDSGDATVSDLQIFYLQKDPSSWLAKSSTVLDQSNADISKFLEQSTKSARNASIINAIVTIGGTLFAVVAGILIALWTAKSITEPLNHLMTVTREIGDSGDLDQN